MIKQRLLRQFPDPQGPLGWVAGTIMRHRSTNVQRSRATVDLLDLAPDDRVLELGHGPGVGLAAALERTDDVVGLERSVVMHRMAGRHLRRAVADGRLRLLVGDAATPPAGLEPLDAIFSCNVWQFWHEPVQVLSAWRACVVGGGLMAVTYRPPQPSARRADVVEAGDRIAAQLTTAGYVDVRVETIELGEIPAVCVLGRAGTV